MADPPRALPRPGTVVHARAPLRLGLAGGGTDVAPYCEIYGGQVLNATISLFTHCHLRVRPAGEPVVFVADDFHQRLELPAGAPLTGPGFTLHQAVYNRMSRQFLEGRPLSLELTTYSDAPPGSGVGSSSTLVVAMVAAYAELLKLPLGEYAMAQIAYEIERVECAMAGGRQDQYAATFGGFNFIEFGAHDQVVVNPLRMRRELVDDLESRLLLFFTGRSRESAQIIQSQIEATRAPDGSAAVNAMHAIKRAASDMKEQLLKGRIAEALDILGASWKAKKQAAPGISNAHIDAIAHAAMQAGARGLKISGAGGGGFMMIAVEPVARYAVIRALEPMGGRFFGFSFVEQGVQSWTRN